MHYFDSLPCISYEGIDKNNNIELEVEEEVERLRDDSKSEIVFMGTMGRTLYIIIGTVLKYEYVRAEISASHRAFTKLTIKGTSIAWTLKKQRSR